MFLIVLQAVLTLFEGMTPANTSLWQVATNPQNWNNLTFILVITGISLGVLGTGAFLGAVFGLKTDFMVFSSMVPGFLSLFVPIMNFAMVIGKYMANIFCSSPIFSGGVPIPANWNWVICPGAFWMVIITGGIMGVYYIFTVLDWWRGRA